MAKQNTLIHVNSNELNYTGDGAKNPQITDLNYGEIAINYKSGYETIFIKNDADVIIPFNPVSLTEKDFWNQKDRIFNSDKSINVICSTNGVIIGDPFSTATGNFSVAEGLGVTANGNYSHAEGFDTYARGESSHTEGSSITASGEYSHAEGGYTKASGNGSHAEGFFTTANGIASHAEGVYTKTTNRAEHASGVYNSSISANSQVISALTTSPSATLFSVGNGVDENNRKNAFEIKYNGDSYITNKLSIGLNNTISGNYTLAQGHQAVASGVCSHAEGYQTKAIENYSHAEGSNTIANGATSHAEGQSTTASGTSSHSEGNGTKATGMFSHSEGTMTQAIGLFSHSEGEETIANGAASHTEGAFTIAYNTYEHAGGRYNSSTSGNSSSTGATIFSIGIGTSDSDRKNAIEVTQTGALIANTSWTTGSDRKLKENITLLENGILDKVLKLKPSRFTLKADLEEEKRVQIGFIAQEIEEIFPEYVVIHTDNKGEETRYLDYEKICVVLTKALQEQQEIIDKQNERLSIIEQKLNIL